MVRWGIAGPGGIGTQFAQGLAELDDAEVVAVSSRSQERAAALAERFGATPYGSYEDLAADPDVDIVYVATPHSRHAADTLMYLEAGKPVLCEKPFSLSAEQGRQMVEAARRRGLFLMEAMWSRFLPGYQVLADLLAEEAIGEPLLVEADFGFRSEIDPTHRHFDLAQGGGSLLDLGVYPLQLCSMVLGTPERVVASGHVGATGVDEVMAALLTYGDARMGVVKSAIRTPLACEARIGGTAGWIRIPAFMHCPGSLTVRTMAGEREIDTKWEGQGLKFQAVEVQRCLAEGLTESPVMPLAETLSIAATMDDILTQLGVHYIDGN